MTTPNETPTWTAAQAKHWFQQVAAIFDQVAREADQYLTAIGDAIDEDAVNEINGAFLSARTAADTCFGAAYRAAGTDAEPAQQQTATYPAAAGQPRY